MRTFFVIYFKNKATYVSFKDKVSFQSVYIEEACRFFDRESALSYIKAACVSPLIYDILEYKIETVKMKKITRVIYDKSE